MAPAPIPKVYDPDLMNWQSMVEGWRLSISTNTYSAADRWILGAEMKPAHSICCLRRACEPHLYLSSTNGTTERVSLSSCITDTYGPVVPHRHFTLIGGYTGQRIGFVSVVLGSLGGGGMAENLGLGGGFCL